MWQQKKIEPLTLGKHSYNSLQHLSSRMAAREQEVSHVSSSIEIPRDHDTLAAFTVLSTVWSPIQFLEETNNHCLKTPWLNLLILEKIAMSRPLGSYAFDLKVPHPLMKLQNMSTERSTTCLCTLFHVIYQSTYN